MTLEIQSVPVAPTQVFVIGSPRSGTTALGWGLAQHPALWTSGESYLFPDLFNGPAIDRAWQKAEVLGTGSWLTAQQVTRAELLAFLGVGVNALMTNRSGGRIWIDHTPQNTLMVDLLAQLLPGAKFVHILRDGRQVVHSMVNFLSALPPERRERFEEAGWAIPWLDFTEACRTWSRHVQAAESFREAHPDRMLTVRNDRLRADPGEQCRRILAFVGVEFDEAPQQHLESQGVNTSFPGGRRTENPWETWSDEQRATFAREAGPTQVRAGLSTPEELGMRMAGSDPASS